MWDINNFVEVKAFCIVLFFVPCLVLIKLVDMIIMGRDWGK